MEANCKTLKVSIIISSVFLILIIFFTPLVLIYENKLLEVLLNIFIGLLGSGCVALLLAIPAYNVSKRQLLEKYWQETRRLIEKFSNLQFLFNEYSDGVIVSYVNELKNKKWKEEFNKISKDKIVVEDKKYKDILIKEYINNHPELVKKVSKGSIQIYASECVDTHIEKLRNKAKQEKTDVTDDVVFEMELIKSIEVNIDYILGLVKKYHDSNMKDKEILVTIQKTIMASPDLRNKKDLIMAFIESLDQDSNVYADFESFMNSKKKEKLNKIINEENLNKEETYNFIKKSFEQGRVETNGTDVSTILPPMSMFTPTNDRQEKKNKVIDKLLDFFDKFFSISNNKF